MKGLLIGDNRSGTNWGGRGVSIAIRRLFREKLDSLDSVFGSEFSLQGAGFGYVGAAWPHRLDQKLHHVMTNRQRRRVFDVIARIQEAAGARDFVAHDPAETAANILRYRKSDPGIAKLYDRVVAADVLVVNGEGDIVLTTPPRREVLMMLGLIELALQLGKRISITNSMVSDCPETGRNAETAGHIARAFRRCDAVVVRDSESLALVGEICPEIQCRLLPDALFEFGNRTDAQVSGLAATLDLLVPFAADDAVRAVNLRQPYCCVGGSAAAPRDVRRALNAFKTLAQRLQTLDMPLVMVQSDAQDIFLREVAAETGAAFVPAEISIHAAAALLANARVLVSGRYHPSIMASLGGTPCVFLGSSAHKMRSVQSVLGYERVLQFPVFPDEQQCMQIAAVARSHVQDGDDLRGRLRTVARGHTLEVSQQLVAATLPFAAGRSQP
jgi:polysaccharide pyruvyl transferase WcaK-like protein